MASERAAAALDFARTVLRLVEHLGRDGRPVALRAALDKAVAALPDHAHARGRQEKPSRRIGFGAVIERVRATEFPHVERQPANGRRSAVHFRVSGYREPPPGDPAGVADAPVGGALVPMPPPVTRWREPAPFPDAPRRVTIECSEAVAHPRAGLAARLIDLATRSLANLLARLRTGFETALGR